jgi:flagellar biogenesis protein FliO
MSHAVQNSDSPRRVAPFLFGAAVIIAALSPGVGFADQPANQDVASESTADSGLNYNPPSWPDPPDAAAMLCRLGLGTMTVLGLCAGTLWIGKHWLRGTPAKAGAGGQLRLVETVSLGNRCTVHLLRAGDQQVLVGVDGTGLKSLVPLPASFENTLAEVRPKDEAIANCELQIANCKLAAATGRAAILQFEI